MLSLRRTAKLPAGRSAAADAAAAAAAPPHHYTFSAFRRSPAAAVAAADRRDAAAEGTSRDVTSRLVAWMRRTAAAERADEAACVSRAVGATAVRCVHFGWTLLQHRSKSTLCIPAAATSCDFLSSSAPAAAIALPRSTAAATRKARTLPAASCFAAAAPVPAPTLPPPAPSTRSPSAATASSTDAAAIPAAGCSSSCPPAVGFCSGKDAAVSGAAAAELWPAGVVGGSWSAAAARLPSGTPPATPHCLRPHAAAGSVSSACVRPAVPDARSFWRAAGSGGTWSPAAGVWGAAAVDIRVVQCAAETGTSSHLHPPRFPRAFLPGRLQGSSSWRRMQHQAKGNICTLRREAAAARTQQGSWLRARDTAAAAPMQQQQQSRVGGCAEERIAAVAAPAARATGHSQQQHPLQQQQLRASCRLRLAAGRASFTTKTETPHTPQQKPGKEKIVLTPKLVLQRSPLATTRFPTTLKEGAYAVLPAQPIPSHIQRPPYACTAGGVSPSPARSSRSSVAAERRRHAASHGDPAGGVAAAAAAASPGAARRAERREEAAAAEEEDGDEEEDVFAPVQPPAAQEKLRRAARVAANALQLCMRAAQEGVTTEDLDRIAHEYIVGVGAYPAAVNFHNFPKAICTSINEVACHGIPDLRPLQKGDILTIDCTSFLDGYFGDCAATVMVGEVLPQHRKLVEASKEALEKAIEMVKPGLPITEIGRCTSQVAHARGFSVVREFSGHFIGKKLHLPPLVSHVYPNSTEGVFRVGQTLTIEPILCEGSPDVFSWKDGWSIATQDGGRCAQFEHTLLVTEDGAEILTLPTI